MECIGAIDQGTQSTRFFLYSKDLSVLGSHQVPLPQIYPKAGWVEQDPNAILTTTLQAISGALQQATQKHGPIKIISIGITNQRETTVVWDKLTGQPLHNAIVWLDSRTSHICSELQHTVGSKDHFRPTTGLPISTYFSAYKLKWMIDNVASVSTAVQEHRCMFGTIDTWLIYKLTAGTVHVTDVTNASRTNLMNLSTLQWDKDILSFFGFQDVIFPEIKSNAEIYGHITSNTFLNMNMNSNDDKNNDNDSTILALIDNVPIAGCLGDQQAAMLGQRCTEHEAKNTYGTGCFMLLNTGTHPVQSTHGLLTTVAYKLGNDAVSYYALEGSIAIAGQGISWLKDSVGMISTASESEELAATVDDCGGVYFVPAFGGLLAPWWRSDARGALLGLTQYTTKAHIVRAMLEAICYQTRDVLEAMKKDADIKQLGCLFVDGGASTNNLLMQMQADILQVPVQRPVHMETTSLGAALAAGIAVGFWSVEEVFDDATRHGSGGRRFVAEINGDKANERHAKWKKAVERSFGLEELGE